MRLSSANRHETPDTVEGVGRVSGVRPGPSVRQRTVGVRGVVCGAGPSFGMNTGSCYPGSMTSRLTVDLGDPSLLQLVRLESVRSGVPIREVVRRALTGYLSNRRENDALARLAHEAFAEWDNPVDAAYDEL